MAVLRAQHLAARAVGGHGIARGTHRAEMEAPFGIGLEASAQVVVRLVLVLVFVESHGRSLPHVDDRAGDGAALDVGHAAEHGERIAPARVAADVLAGRAQRRLRPVERPEQRGIGLASSLRVVEDRDQRREAEQVREQDHLVLLRARGLPDTQQEVEAGLELLLGGTRLANESVQVLHEARHDLAQPRIGRARHRLQDDLGHRVGAVHDTMGERLCHGSEKPGEKS